MKADSVVYCTVILFVLAQAQYVPKKGFAPDARKAVKIAEAVSIPVYGKNKSNPNRPLA